MLLLTPCYPREAHYHAATLYRWPLSAIYRSRPSPNEEPPWPSLLSPQKSQSTSLSHAIRSNDILDLRLRASSLHLPLAFTRRIILHILRTLIIHYLDIDRLATVEDAEGLVIRSLETLFAKEECKFEALVQFGIFADYIARMPIST